MLFRALYIIGLLVVTSSIFWLALHFGLIKQFFQFLVDYLPLVLPLLVSGLSILMKASEIKDRISVLRLSQDIAIGILSFDIWALSSSLQEKSRWVAVNSREVIASDYVIILLIIGVITAVGCVVTINFPYGETKLRETILSVALILTLCVYLLPFGLLSPVQVGSSSVKPLPKKFTVVVPYKDPEIVRVAPALLADKNFVEILSGVEAPSQEEGKMRAAALAEERIASRKVGSGRSKPVVQNEGILAIPEECLNNPNFISEEATPQRLP